MRTGRTASAVAILLALAAGHVITTRTDLGESDPSFVTSGSLGEPVHLVYGDVEVTDVRPAQYVVPQNTTELARLAGGVFVLVSVQVLPTREPTSFLAAYLVDEQGRQFRASHRSECAQSVDGQTGLPAYALFCFDVPSSVLAGLHHQIGRGDLLYSTLQGDELADVDLQISSADARSWARTRAAYLAESTDDQPIVLQSVDLQQAPS